MENRGKTNDQLFAEYFDLVAGSKSTYSGLKAHCVLSTYTWVKPGAEYIDADGVNRILTS
ncbi:MAG: hypothetical protein Q8O43_00505 [Dehalococcoidia bacterium]|nr:hypothetical protein [Dehalococcoidia bacterium]